MITPIPFDPHRFRTAAPSYLAGRPGYAPALVPLVAEICGLDGTGRVLDLGCGPAQLARAFLPYAAAAVAMDPEPEMVALGRSLSEGLPVTFALGGSADLDPATGPFRLVAIGRAFQWMDRVETARRLNAMVEPGGAVVLFRIDHVDVPDNAWREAYQAVLDAHGAGGARAAWRQPGWVRHEAVLLDSPFSSLTRLGVVERVRTPVAALLDRALSMSPTTAGRLGESGVAALRAGIDAVLGGAAEAGAVTEVLESVALVARRP